VMVDTQTTLANRTTEPAAALSGVRVVAPPVAKNEGAIAWWWDR
jgi:hypothetical protein